MPIYEFECKTCKKITQKYIPINSKTKICECKHCGSRARKILSSGIFRIKGFSESNGYARENK